MDDLLVYLVMFSENGFEPMISMKKKKKEQMQNSQECFFPLYKLNNKVWEVIIFVLGINKKTPILSYSFQKIEYYNMSKL